MEVKKRITFIDIVISLLVLLIIVVICFVSFKRSVMQPQFVVVSSHGEENVFPLQKEGAYSIRGMLGDTVIQIKNREVQIISSPCPLKTCMNRKITKNGETLVCLPNGVAIVLRAVFEQKREYDALSF